jgi:acyl-coenzyme A thioesterase PaaI-like protein
VFTPPSASTAAGPVNIITIVNRRIAIYDNPNAIVASVGGGTRVPQVLSPTSYLPTSEALLDAWMGENVLNLLCPTGRDSNISCLVDNASVRYDQMQGRFLVLLTVTDTGVETLGNIVTKPRKASWVLLISKFSQFPSQGTAGSSDIFITPTPPIGSTSGVNTANWNIYYGNALNGPGTDGFGNTTTANGTVGQGNINSLPGIKNAGQALDTTTGHDAIFDCRPSAIAASGADPAKHCYFPTSARLGLDNDNVTITSAVIDVNYAIPAAPSPVLIPAFAGTRVRVLKKGGGAPELAAGLYQKSLAGAGLTAANQYAPLVGDRVTGDYYDVYAVTNIATGTPIATFPAVTAKSPYTLAPIVAPLSTGQAMFCEPARVRGRAAASYTNSLTPSLTSQNYIECIVSTQIPVGAPANPIPQNTVYIQPVTYNTVAPNNPPANTNFAIPYYVSIVGDGTANPTTGMQAAFVEPFINPSTIPQANYTGTSGGPAAGSPSPVIYVGDDRPHEVVFREAHLYNARVGGSTTTFQTPGSPLSSTVFYDVIQKLTAGLPAIIDQPVLLAKWTNTNAYAPMYEVPANVATAGQTSPINVFPWLEKLFVATTYPQLTASDPRATQAVQGLATASTSTCVASNVVPNIIGGIPTATLGYPGLYDMRCGNDVFDNRQNFRDPITGQIVINIPNSPLLLPVTPALRGGSSTDPNNGSLWNFGLYAQRRFGGVGNGGQLGSYMANYELAFPTTDPYNNTTALFSDCNSVATCPFFVQVQTAAQLGLALNKGDGTVGLNDSVTRQEMARLVVLSMMDENAVTAYLNSSGGCTTSFADVASGCAGGAPVASVTNTSGVSNYWRYIETMRRKKITTGCFVNDAIANFCPTALLTRGQMAVFLVRAKFSNVYPSVISGCPTPQAPACPGISGGDNFGLTVGVTPYFSDVTATNSFFLYIQKMYELRITNGINAVPGAPAYGDTQTLTRGQLLTFIVRAFFF